MKMVKVFVKGWVMGFQATQLTDGGHHSMPVRFKCEDGGYEWLWVRKNNISSCPVSRKKPARRVG